MRRNIVYGAGFIMVGLFLSGCLTRTYTVVRDRVDQDVSGNQGFIGGSVPSDYQQSPKKFTTRKTRVVEVEFGKPLEAEKTAPSAAAEGTVSAPEPQAAEPLEADLPDEEFQPAAIEEAKPKELPQTYVVQKNDTLQKISQQLYGTTKKWVKIYEANKDKLKTPDRIRAGQTLKIPKE